MASCPMPRASELILYRAAQEALNNCVKHARASAVQITLCRHQDSLQLCVIDDGVGFVVPNHLDRLTLKGHLGLAGLQQRLERVGGALTIRSAPEEGTLVQVDMYLPGGTSDPHPTG